MNVLLVGETTSHNFGDQAIFITLKHLLESEGYQVTGWDLSHYRYVLTAGDPGSAMFPNGGSVDTTGTGFNSLAKAQILKIVDIAPDIVKKLLVLVSKKRAEIMNRQSWRTEIGNFDLVLFGGGALLMDNNWSFPLALEHFSKAVRAADRPYACIGCSSGSQYSMWGRRWLRKFLDGCEYIALRDELSLQGLRRIGNYDADVYVDSALTIASLNDDQPACSAGTLGLNVISPTGHPRLNRAVYKRYLSELGRFIAAIREGKAGDWDRVLLFTTGESRDHDAMSRLASSLPLQSTGVCVEVASRPQSLKQLCETIAGMGLVVSTRLHAGILAKSFGRPLVVVGWDTKIKGFCDMVGIDEYYVDVEECRAEFLVEKVKQIVNADLDQPDQVEACISKLTGLPDRLRSLTN